MLDCSHQILDLDELRNYVNRTLCDQHQLELDSFPLTERILLRRGQPCGKFFCIHGPGSSAFTAVWETDTNAIFFYGPAGERFQKTQLLAAPALAPVGL